MSTFHPKSGDITRKWYVIDAADVVLGRLAVEAAYRHSGYPGGLTTMTLGRSLEVHPERVIEEAIAGMMPHNKLSRASIKKLHVYAGSEHRHAAQKPENYEIKQVAQ